jgi:hypothetical protein
MKKVKGFGRWALIYQVISLKERTSLTGLREAKSMSYHIGISNYLMKRTLISQQLRERFDK